MGRKNIGNIGEIMKNDFKSSFSNPIVVIVLIVQIVLTVVIVMIVQKMIIILIYIIFYITKQEDVLKKLKNQRILI